MEYSERVIVDDGQSLNIESFTSSSDLYCVGEEVQFDVVWNNDSIPLKWFVLGSGITKTAGGLPTDTFYRGTINRGNELNLVVSPDDRCGIQNLYTASISENSTIFRQGLVCNEGCYPLGDSCYAFVGGISQLAHVGGNAIGCDSFILLSLMSVDVLPSPKIECNQTNDGILIEWERVSGAEHYVVFANRDSIATVIGGTYFIENGMIGTTPFVVKVQPIGECTYLPAEIECSGVVSQASFNTLVNKITVYPNPTTGNLNIKTDLQIEEIEIYNAAGRFLQKENSTSFDLKIRSRGIYFLKIKTNVGVGVKRILIN